MNCIFFVHIPKTAGTSFRIAAQNYFGSEKISSDYGRLSDTTSADVIQHVYGENDLYQFGKSLERGDIRFLTGHVAAQKYNPVFSPDRVATFLRNPLDQVVSHYEHFVRHYDYSGSIEDFVTENRFTNLQTRMTSTIPLALYGGLGLTEKYNESLDVFNSYFEVDFEKLSLNTKKDSDRIKPVFDTVDEVPSDLTKLITRYNRRDIARYEHANKLFEIRSELSVQNLPYTFGLIRESNSQKLAGVAYQTKQEKPIIVEILRNSEVVAEVKASEFRPNLQRLNVARKGCIGFSHTFDINLGKDEIASCRVKETGQVLLEEKG